MKAAPWMFMLVAGCALSPVDPAKTSLVDAQPRGGRAFEVTLRAPAAADLYLENCNGAINWGLADAADRDIAVRWSVMRNQCLSPAIKIAAGTTKSFQLTVPWVRQEGPRAGLYRIVLLGVYTAWAGPRPLEGPQVPLEDRVSARVVIGDDTLPGEAEH